MVLLRDVGQVETRSGPFGDSVNHDAKIDARFAPNAHRLGNHFGHNRWYFYMTWVRWKLVSICLEILLISVQDRCPVYAECTMGKEIDLGTPDGTPR